MRGASQRMYQQVKSNVQGLGRSQRQLGMGFIMFAMVVGNVANAEGHKQQWDQINRMK